MLLCQSLTILLTTNLFFSTGFLWITCVNVDITLHYTWYAISSKVTNNLYYSSDKMHFAATTTCSPSTSPADMMVAEEIQELLSKLKELVPNMPRNKKLSKLEIIQYVIDYIDDLQSALESHPSVAGQFSSFQQRSSVVNNTSCGQVRQPLSTISISEKRSFTDDTMRSNKKMSWILQDPLTSSAHLLSSYSSALSFFEAKNPRE